MEKAMTEQTPNAAQIRAALGLIKWENEDLARLCQISPQSVSNIKRGVTRPQPRILAAIRRVLENQGVEFLEGSGVRLKSEGVEILQGYEGFRKFYDLIYERLSIYGGQACLYGVDERLFIKYEGDFAQMHMDRMAELVKRRKDIQMKVLIREGDTYFVASHYATYRWESAEGFSPTVFYVFADYLALISFQGENAPKVVLIHSASFANAYRKQFMVQWRQAKIPPKV
jgi:transcriptional regulator with XRE-family HTH domain